MMAKKMADSGVNAGAAGQQELGRTCLLPRIIPPMPPREQVHSKFVSWSFEDAEAEYLHWLRLTTMQSNPLPVGPGGAHPALGRVADSD